MREVGKKCIRRQEKNCSVMIITREAEQEQNSKKYGNSRQSRKSGCKREIYGFTIPLEFNKTFIHENPWRAGSDQS